MIDPSSGMLWVVAKTEEVVSGVTSYYQRLHALDITFWREKLGGPFVIAASVPGTRKLNENWRVYLSPLHQNQRAGLVLSDGLVEAAWGSHCDGVRTPAA